MKENFDRRNFLKTLGLGACSLGLGACAAPSSDPPEKGEPPNIVLLMSDDQGWGDAGFMGHHVLMTPNLDEMAAGGIRFDRFYSAAPVCSPTRGSCLTGRHPYRYGIFSANVGHMPAEELTLAEAMKTRGYATGHFGKWHLGTLTKIEKDSNRGGPDGAEHYSPPWENGFDVCFSTEAKVPTWNPMENPKKPGEAYGTYYWTGPGERVSQNLEGDDSRVIMDRAIPFIRGAVGEGRPFLAVIWFHAPHAPVIAGPKHRKLYSHCSEDEQHYFGCITAMDEQIGRLRGALRNLGVERNTMVWFASDNGPEGRRREGRHQGSAGPFQGRKRSLFEGGIRVPALLEWPAKIDGPRVVNAPCCTSDYFPTIRDAAGIPLERIVFPQDGVSLLGLIEGGKDWRPLPIAFESKGQIALSDNQYKIISLDGGETFMLFDLIRDPGEEIDLSAEHPEITAAMRATLDRWRASCRDSREGKDYL